MIEAMMQGRISTDSLLDQLILDLILLRVGLCVGAFVAVYDKSASRVKRIIANTRHTFRDYNLLK